MAAKSFFEQLMVDAASRQRLAALKTSKTRKTKATLADLLPAGSDARRTTGSKPVRRRLSADARLFKSRCSADVLVFFFVWNGFAESGCPARRAVDEELPFSGLICATIRNFGGC